MYYMTVVTCQYFSTVAANVSKPEPAGQSRSFLLVKVEPEPKIEAAPDPPKKVKKMIIFILQMFDGVSGWAVFDKFWVKKITGTSTVYGRVSEPACFGAASAPAPG